MTRLTILFFVFFFAATVAQAQYRGTEPVRPNASEGVVHQESGSPLLGLFDLNKFSMQQSISMSYNTFGGQSIGLTKYTNSIRYQIAQPLSLRADVSLQYSPFNSLPQAFRNDLNKIYLERAQLDYHPSDNMRITLQYRNFDSYYYNGMYPYMGGGMFLGTPLSQDDMEP